MLKLNEANRQKVMELCHVYNKRFWGIWERCLFLMMAPLFSRYGLHAIAKEIGNFVRGRLLVATCVVFFHGIHSD